MGTLFGRTPRPPPSSAAEELDRFAGRTRRQTAAPEVQIRMPREIAAEYAAGEISHAAMIEELAALTYTDGFHPEPHSVVSDAYVPGLWDDLASALHSGYISDADFREIVDTVSGRVRTDREERETPAV